ncbi:class I SAM-dependent rRNA methyltransferase [Thiohalophilus thiocyanatoxydans]|uniref:SAM-dependent methyltransferase n=1 Tax=Thiohalophilus thiocyanatoxydans TaxID=381308 RepID=A0A4R8ITD1_9GAMM|nr:class I SAM-dependent rRNA methyltransferase [Thiohalophilus thiocyanatoxydans]TDY04311.1 SAM-dependent methyltransferase [Thiohalophilus thiocyanatoxydans]
MTDDNPRQLRLKKREERRLKTGHLWVYSNEVDVKTTPLTEIAPGEQLQIADYRGNVLGSAYVNPNSLICARLFSHQPEASLDADLIRGRLERALQFRHDLFAAPHYRLIYGESDGLPGLVVDRYDRILVVQITTVGMDVLRDTVLDVLDTVLQPAVIYLRNDSSAREQEGLERYTTVIKGELPEQMELIENKVRFQVPLAESQKTGWYFDHRLNRLRCQAYAPGKRVLDVFSYVGAWGVQALHAGASEVICVDASKEYLQVAEANAAAVKSGGLATLDGDAFEVLRQLYEDGEQFDIVVLDPPAFIKRRKDMKEGELAYRRINRLAMRLLKKDGLLISASCSYHLGRKKLLDNIRRAAHKLEQEVQVLEQGHQGPDHPVHAAMPETDYLKAYFCRLLAM